MNSTSATDPGTATDAVLRQLVGYHIKRTSRSVCEDLSRRLGALDLRLSTYSTLTLIVDNPGLRQSAFAEALDIERSNMVAIIDELEQHGWVRRERLDTDRRAYALFATQSGKRLNKKAVAVNNEQEAMLLNDLTATEIKHLVKMLEKIETAPKRMNR